MRSMTLVTGLLVAAGLAGSRPAAAAVLQGADGLSPLDRPVTLALAHVSLKDALDAVAREAGVRIAYSGRVVPLDRSVSLQLDAVPVATALDSLLLGTGAVPTLDRSGQILLVAGRSVQTGSVAGTLRDALSGAPLADATVSLLGTRFAARSGADGRYAIAAVPPGTYRLRARLLGYAPGDTAVVVQDGQQTTVDLRLRATPIELNPVVSIGYDTVRRRDLTGSVVSVTAEDYETKAAPTVTLSSGLQGKAAGVQVTSNSGLPGGGVSVHIRGTGSITGNSEPLYVIDGIPAEQGTGSSNPQDNPLMSLDPRDVETIDVLKDASATAIYGARGANGVVLITTRRGRTGQTNMTLESSAGYATISNTISVLNSQQFMQITNEARVNAGRTPLFTAQQIAAAPTFNYPAMMLRTAPQASEAITLSGGSEHTRYLLSGNYVKQQGVEIGSDFARYGLRLNLDADITERFRMGTSLSLTRVARNAPSEENGSLGNSANGIEAAMQFAPFQAPVDSTGNWVKQSPTTEPVPNPIANAEELTDLNTSSRMLGSVFGTFDVTPSLRIKSTVGGNFQFDDFHYFAPRTILAGGAGGDGWMYAGQSRNLTNDNTVTFHHTMGPGTMNLLGGFTVQTWYSENVRGEGQNFPTDATGPYNLGSGRQLVPPGSGVSEQALLSYIGRANYNIGDRYLFTVTGRRDGSSVFGVDHKWGFFPSGAFAWRLSEEPFLRHQTLFNDLKLRLSYGTVGNQGVAPYQSLSQLSIAWVAAGATEIPALAPSSTMPNPDLHWEQRREVNAGIDAALLNNRVSFTFDMYRSQTTDLLMFVSVPSTTGFSGQLRNIGSLQNHGVEVSLSTLNVTGSRLTWRTALNLAHNSNKILDLGTQLDSSGQAVPLTQILVSPRTGNFFSPNNIYVLQVGQPIGAIYGYRVTGLWQAGDACYLKNAAQNCVPGEYKIVDVNGDSVISSADQAILGYGQPKLYGGISNHLTYGAFALDIATNFSIGNKIINAGNAYGCLGIMQANERTCMLDRWTPTDTNTMVPRANNARPRRLYSTLVEDGSYLRVQALTLSYDLPAGIIPSATSARLYLTGQNLLTLTGYSGFDPDVNSMGGDPRFGGIDIGAYPRSRVWNFGISANF